LKFGIKVETVRFDTNFRIKKGRTRIRTKTLAPHPPHPHQNPSLHPQWHQTPFDKEKAEPLNPFGMEEAEAHFQSYLYVINLTHFM